MKHQEELKQKFVEDVEPQTLQQQENISIKGQSARHLVMQKLMRKAEVCFIRITSITLIINACLFTV